MVYFKYFLVYFLSTKYFFTESHPFPTIDTESCLSLICSQCFPDMFTGTLRRTFIHMHEHREIENHINNYLYKETREFK